MEYQRYKPKYERPFGMGAFFDYVLAITRQLESKSLRASGRKKSLAAPQPQQSAEERCNGEGGNRAK
jgi:hypothetical protein